jgi:hypothetical protein
MDNNTPVSEEDIQFLQNTVVTALGASGSVIPLGSRNSPVSSKDIGILASALAAAIAGFTGGGGGVQAAIGTYIGNSSGITTVSDLPFAPTALLLTNGASGISQYAGIGLAINAVGTAGASGNIIYSSGTVGTIENAGYVNSILWSSSGFSLSAGLGGSNLGFNTSGHTHAYIAFSVPAGF